MSAPDHTLADAIAALREEIEGVDADDLSAAPAQIPARYAATLLAALDEPTGSEWGVLVSADSDEVQYSGLDEDGGEAYARRIVADSWMWSNDAVLHSRTVGPWRPVQQDGARP